MPEAWASPRRRATLPPMPRRPKKPPWSAALPPPDFDKPLPPPTPPREGPLLVGHSTTAHMPESRWECGRCENIREGAAPTEISLDHSPRCPYRGTGRDPEGQG
jgi:hypothetical protein